MKAAASQTIRLRQAAHRLARNGFSVFPLAPGSKVPRKGSHGFEDASNDTEMIDYWWNQNPRSNIGVRTLRLAVLDIDLYKPDAGSSLRRLTAMVGELDETAVALTPRGGVHYWFAVAEADSRHLSSGYTSRLPINGEIVRFSGIDMKCGGRSYIVAPPSITKDGAYTWRREGKTPPAPIWLRGSRPPVTVPAGTRSPSVVGSARRVAALCDVVRAAPVGERNTTLNWAAFRMAEIVSAGVINRGLACDALVESALAAGLSESEAQRTARSGLVAGERMTCEPDHRSNNPAPRPREGLY
jgi:hypothetical protein